jgi:hypothetical protein
VTGSVTAIEQVERTHAAIARFGAALMDGFAPTYRRLGFPRTADGMEASAGRMRRNADDREARADRIRAELDRLLHPPKD